MSSESSNRAFDPSQLLRVMRRRAPIVVVCVLFATMAAFVASRLQQKQYTAVASVLFRDQTLNEEAAGLAATVSVNPQSQTDTNLSLATLPHIAAATAAVVGHGLTSSDVSSAVTVAQESDTDLASVSATAGTPALAAELANTYASELIASGKQEDGAYYANALRAVELQLKSLTPAQQRGPNGVDLQDRATSLRLLSQLQASDVQLAQAALLPTSPSAPKVLRNTALGFLIGLLLGLALALLAERFDRRLREPADLEDVYGVPVLGVVPESQALRAEGEAENTRLGLPPEEAEIFGLLRAHIRYFNVDHQLRLVCVVSAAPGDGKTTIARNLSLAASTIGTRVLFIEADLRRPSASTHFGLSGSRGIAEVLIGGLPLEDAVETVAFANQGGQTSSIDVLLAGDMLPPNPAQAIESQAMHQLLQNAKSMYDLVIVDTPPLSLVSDAFPIVRAADGVLIISRLGRNRRDVAARLKQTLTNAEATIIGVVANGYRRRDSASYGYEYSYYRSPGVMAPANVNSSTNGITPHDRTEEHSGARRS